MVNNSIAAFQPQAALRRKEADCAAIETEISRQMADYERLKGRLLQQVRVTASITGDLS